MKSRKITKIRPTSRRQTSPHSPLLDLICKTDEQIRQIRGVRNALQEVVDACAGHMDVALAVLILPGKGITVRSDNLKKPLINAGKLVSELEQDLIGSSKITCSETTINDGSPIHSQDIRPRVPCKSIITPISTDDGELEGLLVVANRPDAPDFTKRHLSLVQAIVPNVADILDARFDQLTGLINRKEFETLLEDVLSSKPSKHTNHCILHLNLDSMRAVDESLGRDACNAAIRQVAQYLASSLKGTGSVARIGEDDFVVLIDNCPLDRGWIIGHDIRRGITDLNVIWKRPIKLTVSIGVARLASDSETVESALAAAKIACIVAKDRGKDQVALYRQSDAVHLHGKERMQGVEAIQQALQSDRFELYGQRIEPLQGKGKTSHFEVLIRVVDEKGQLAIPDDFIPHAEHSRLMPEIDRWVVSHSLDLLARYRTGLTQRKVLLSINLSGQTLCDNSFLDFVLEELSRTRIPAKSICFEVTETTAILNMPQATQFMTTLRNKGLRFSLDDFGSGLSSFSYLKKLPIDFLKIDGQFVREIAEDPVSNAIVAAINQMSHAMGLKTIAEFVESKAVKTQLKSIGVDYGQGFGISKPGPLARQLDLLLGRISHVRNVKRG